VDAKHSWRNPESHPHFSETGEEIAHYEEELRKKNAFIKLCSMALEKLRRAALEKGASAVEEPGISIIMQFIGTISEERNDHQRARDRLIKEIGRLQARPSGP